MVPWKYGFKSIKSINKITLVEKMPLTTRNISSPREYGFYSNVNRYVDHPRWSQATERRLGELTKRKTSRGQWEELIPVVSVFALQGFLAPYAERSPGDDLQAPLPDFPLTASANSKGFIPDAFQGGLNLSARRGLSSKVHQGNVSLCGEEALLDFVGAGLDGDSVSALPLVGEFGQFVGKNTGELLGLGG